MSLKSLEEKAIEIFLNDSDKTLTKVVSVEGSVKSVKGSSKPIEIEPLSRSGKSYLTGYQKKLEITLNPETSTLPIKKEFKFKGESPVREGDRIKAGIILDKYFRLYDFGNLLYLGLLKKDGSFERIDFMDGYKPTHDDLEDLGLP